MRFKCVDCSKQIEARKQDDGSWCEASAGTCTDTHAEPRLGLCDSCRDFRAKAFGLDKNKRGLRPGGGQPSGRSWYRERTGEEEHPDA